MSILQCVRCGHKMEVTIPKHKCPVCGGLLEYIIDYEKLKGLSLGGSFTFWRYRNFLPEVKNLVTMQEGGTPLYRARRLSAKMNLTELYFKDETRNPTNSFRDRSAALVISNILDLGFTSVVCATNGNMGASLSAYCAKYGINCHLVVPKLVDMGKMAQMLIHDAVIEEFGETVDKAIYRAEKISKETGWYQATPELNPLVIEAQKTIAFEIVEQMGVPNWLIISMGSGGTLYSVWKGFMELYDLGGIDRLPRIVGVQAEGCSPIVNAYFGVERKITKPSTHAIGILVAEPLLKELSIKAIRQSKGLAISVSDQEIFLAEREIARLEGLFAEPASSGTVAALKKMVDEALIEKDEVAVCLIGGSGLKATDVIQALSKKRKMSIMGTELSTKEKILRILDRRDAYGYEIWKELEKIMTRSAIYQHLNDLRNRGLISLYAKEGRKYFAITEKGRRILKAIDEVKTIL